VLLDLASSTHQGQELCGMHRVSVTEERLTASIETETKSLAR